MNFWAINRSGATKVLASQYLLRSIIFVWLVAAVGFQTWRRNETIRYDVSAYYNYLPAAFIYHDLSMTHLQPENRFNIWYEQLPDGRRYLRMTMGLAIMYLPFFLLAHLMALLLHLDTGGYSMPYSIGLSMAGLFYASWGILLLRKTLLERVTTKIAHLTLLSIALGTNLFYYVSIGGAYSHAFSFFLMAALLRLLVRWHTLPTLENSVLMGGILGLITLIRPTNSLVLVFLLLYGIQYFGGILSAVLFYRRHWRLVGTMGLMMILIWLPQFCYWKYATSHWLFYSYSGERFYFSQPHIWEGLLSYRKGWFVYTPIMVLAVYGLTMLRRRFPDYRIAIPVYLTLHIYVVFSWWIWWYGGSFGQRPMVDIYPILALPLAVFYEQSLKRRRIQWVIGLFTAGCIFLNVFQTVQMRLGVLHWDAMTRTAYWNSFLRVHRPADMDLWLKKPDLGRAYEGKTAE